MITVDLVLTHWIIAIASTCWIMGVLSSTLIGQWDVPEFIQGICTFLNSFALVTLLLFWGLIIFR